MEKVLEIHLYVSPICNEYINSMYWQRTNEPIGASLSSHSSLSLRAPSSSQSQSASSCNYTIILSGINSCVIIWFDGKLFGNCPIVMMFFDIVVTCECGGTRGCSRIILL